MAISFTSLTSGTGNFSGTSVATASVTPTANHLILLAIAVADTTNLGAGPFLSASGNGLTWVRIAEQVHAAGDRRNVGVFRAMGASPSSGAITVTDSSGQTPVDAAWSVVDVSGIDTTGTNGSGAVGNPVKATDTGTGSLTLTITDTPAAGDASFAVYASEDGATIGVDANFTLIDALSGADQTMKDARDLNHHTSITFTVGAGNAFGGMAFLVKAPSAGGTVVFRRTLSGEGTHSGGRQAIGN